MKLLGYGMHTNGGWIRDEKMQRKIYYKNKGIVKIVM